MSCLIWALAEAQIKRFEVIRRFNPQRTVSSNSTPIQVGNGDFAFGADITGLQTFYPFNILSSWGWHNSSLPTTPGQTSPADFYGQDWWTHGRLVNYAQPNASQSDISNWMIRNPQRANLGRIGLYFGNRSVAETHLQDVKQELDLVQGRIYSKFKLNGTPIEVQTVVDPKSDTVGFLITSNLLALGQLGLFFDYPYTTLNKFDAPFVGNWSAVDAHQTSMQQAKGQAQIQHDMDATTYFTSIKWDSYVGSASMSGPLPASHRYILLPFNTTEIRVSANFAPVPQTPISAGEIVNATVQGWAEYWGEGAFIDLTGGTSNDSDAVELQRRIILSQYLLRVNEAGKDPPQESGLVDNGWYGKFHLEMYLWHGLQWDLWGRPELLDRSTDVYKRFLPSSLERAAKQGYTGARWGKMSDPSGRSAPGEINSLLIWQQPHPMYFAEMEYRRAPTAATLQKWDEVLSATADFMASYAFWNESTNVYDLGPPLHVVSENTKPNVTINPTFELAYWRFGLKVASDWKERQGQSIPTTWTHVAENLAPLPIINKTYPIYEGIPNMWIDPISVTDHPAMIGIYGLLPLTPGVNTTIISNTLAKIYETWDFEHLYGWDFAMLAMSAARMGDSKKAVEFLLDKSFAFDDVGMPLGGTRVATPYFPVSGALLAAVAMMSGGWDGDGEGTAMRWPEEWGVKAEGFIRAM